MKCVQEIKCSFPNFQLLVSMTVKKEPGLVLDVGFTVIGYFNLIYKEVAVTFVLSGLDL